MATILGASRVKNISEVQEWTVERDRFAKVFRKHVSRFLSD